MKKKRPIFAIELERGDLGMPVRGLKGALNFCFFGHWITFYLIFDIQTYTLED